MKHLTTLWKRITLNLDSYLDRKFSALSDEEKKIACHALSQQVPPSFGTRNPFLRAHLRLATHIQLLWLTNVLVALMPTFRQLRPYEHMAGESLARAIGWDFVDNTLARQLRYLLTGQGMDERLDVMHGFMIQKVGNMRNAGEGALWFGQNRERILAVMPVLMKDGVFSRERIDLLLEATDNGGSAPFIGGAL